MKIGSMLDGVIAKLESLEKRLGIKPPAEDPTQLQWKYWRQALLQTKKAIGDKNLGILAAGVAYFATLSFFPLMVALVSISAFFIKPDQLQDIVAAANIYLPKDIASLITTQLTNLIDKPSVSLVAGIIAILIALWGISGAVENLVKALNTAYGVRETRNFFTMKLTSLSLTAGTVVLLLIFIPMMGITEDWLAGLGVPGYLVMFLSIVRWLLLIGIIMLALAVLYRYGPNRQNPKWQWVSWGAIAATVLWLLATIAFFVYARYFAHFSDSYSLFAGIIVMMTWFNLSALTFLIGAEVNHNLEKQTNADTTEN